MQKQYAYGWLSSESTGGCWAGAALPECLTKLMQGFCVFWTFMVLSWDVSDRFLLLCFRRTTNKTKGLNFVRKRGLVKYPRSVPHQPLCASHGALETRNSSDVPESLVWSNWSSLQLPKKSLSTFHKVSLMLRRKSLLVEQTKCLLHSKPPLALVEKAF